MHPDLEEGRGDAMAFSILECYFEIHEQLLEFRKSSQGDALPLPAEHWEAMLALEAISVLNACLFISMQPAVLTVSDI